MRTEKSINEELEKALEHYRSNAQNLAGKSLAASNKQVRDLRRELSDAISSGAKACPKCKNPPVGMRRGDVALYGTVQSVYEIGCAVCIPVVKGNTRTSVSSVGTDAASAVKNWNVEAHSTDGKIDQV
ncbi:MAG: hypothetical protein H0U87_09515 [Acidobacteria bacterium]|jgi:hypothetical protein|nr:hypothetical protein [Acidobacteriota bacterium]